MPLYGFICASCGHEFESLVHHTVEKGERCTNCGSIETKKEAFPKRPPSHVIKGASAANNYGLKPNSNKKRGK